MTTTIETAMVMGAGLGTRMRPLTDDRPKALVEVWGKPMIDHALDRLRDAGVKRVIVNVHAFADRLCAHLEKRSDLEIIISDERGKLLDTGGGVKNALPLLGQDPIIIHNCDSLWVEGMGSSLERLKARWDPEKMDALLMLAITATIVGDVARGDFLLDAYGRVTWREERSVSPFMYTGVQIIKPEFFAEEEDEVFSTTRVWNRLMEEERLYGVRMDGVWMHVGTPQALKEAEAFLKEL